MISNNLDGAYIYKERERERELVNNFAALLILPLIDGVIDFMVSISYGITRVHGAGSQLFLRFHLTIVFAWPFFVHPVQGRDARCSGNKVNKVE